MKKAVGWIAILLMAFLVSCTPEVSESISDIEIPTEGVTTDVLVRVNEDSTVDLLFKAVPHATSYQYRIGEGELRNIRGTAEGVYLVEKSINTGSTNGTITLFAQLGGKQVEVGSGDYSISNVNKIVPDVILMSRTENEAVFSIIPYSENIVYKVDLLQDDIFVRSVEIEEVEDNIITITGLDGGAYTMVFAHKIKGEENWGVSTKTIAVMAYGESEFNGMHLSYDKARGEFRVVDIPSDVSTINLAVRKDKNIIYEKKDIPVSATNVVINDSVIDIPSLSKVEVYSYVGDNNTQGKSNPVRFTKPLTQIQDKKVNWQSVELFFNFADDIKESLEFTAVCNDKLYPVENRKDGSIIITGFDSNSTYENITVTAKGYEEYPMVIDTVETLSFAGYYKWSGEVKCDGYSSLNGKTEFSIRVENAPDNSDYGYYVYFDSDPVDKGEKNIRIMPLIDTSMGELKAPSINAEDNKYPGGILVSNPGENFVRANNAYLLNSSKWNASGQIPINWTILDSSIVSHDRVTTDTFSVVNFAGIFLVAAETYTSFYFEEENGDPVVIFKNTGDALAQIGLVYNVENADNKDKKYEFKLTQV